ncbi:MAG: putative phospholipid-binding lipoprotein MlaA precursor, partial [Pseudomonadota bacterium]
ASEAGLEKRKEDFGQTLGHWGVKPGPYLVLPLLGPATLRDTAAMPVDWQGSPSQFFEGSNTRLGVTALRLTDTRAGLLKAGDALKQAALDPYNFVRDAWLQKRENDVYDGNPPSDFDYTDPDAP